MLLARALRWYLRSSLRGRTRLTALATRHLRPLWSVPIRIEGCDPLYVDLRSAHARYLLQGEPWARPPWEPAEQSAMRRVVSRGQVALDIGGNIGVHSVLLSALIGPEGRLFIFEPNLDLVPGLRRTARGLGNASVLTHALSDETGRRTLFISPDAMKTSLTDWTDRSVDGEARQATCELRRLDDLVADGTVPQPDFIKCDVEGAELLVFRGARRVLDRAAAPIVLFEVNRHTAEGFGVPTPAAKDFLASLSQTRYQFFLVHGTGELARLDAPLQGGNVLAIPEGKMAAFPELQ
jgi:FkbM family methyltransferase